MKTGINITRCNIGSAEMHNTRDPKYIAAVNASPKKRYSIYEDQTPRNSSWVNPVHSRKTLPELLEELRNLYRAKVGQAPQEEDRVRTVTDKKTGLTRTVTTAGWSPIREGVCPILESTTVEDFRPFAEWLHSRGLTLIRVDLHHDEGHTDELTGERKYNRHAHLIIDWVDHATGKTVKLTKDDTREMQTRLADSLRMERGVSKEITGADHLSPDEQRAKAAAEKVRALQAEISETARMTSDVLDLSDKTIRDSCRQMQHLGRDTVRHFDELCAFRAVEPTKAERQSRDSLDKECRRDLSAVTGNDLLRASTLLGTLWAETTKAVYRIGRRLQGIARDIPFWKKSRLAHEAHLQARMEAAEEKAANSTAEANNALKRAENALREAEQRERRAEQREREAEQVRLQSQGVIDEQLEQARANGIIYADMRWENWKETKYDPLEREVGSLRAKVEKYADSVRFIAHALTRYHPDSVRQFEEFGLRDAVGRETWDEAKQQNHQPTHGHGLHR